MGKYSASHQTPAGTTLAIINLTGSAAIRCKIYDLIIGSDATPADQATEFTMVRTTDAGTGGTALTEAPLDPLTVAATGAAIGGTFSAQPAQGNILLMIPLNQRATFRWVAAPGSELISAATAANGIMLNSVGSTATPNINATLIWEE